MSQSNLDLKQLRAIMEIDRALQQRPGAYTICLARENVEQLLLCIQRLSGERLDAKKSAGAWYLKYTEALAGRTV